MTPAPDPLATILGDLAAIGRKLVETSESALAHLEAREAECRPRLPDAAAQPMTTMTKPESMLLTRREAARLLRICDRTFDRLRADPRAKFPRPLGSGRLARWRETDVDRWIAGRNS